MPCSDTNADGPPTFPPWLQALYPFTPRSFITPRGARLSYLDEGQGGEAVLMLHGNPTWSFYFRELVRAVSTTRRCIVPDHIGMGFSDKPQDYPYTLATRIDDVAALVQSLGLTKLHLVVHDWGGAIGFGFAVRHPDLIDRLAILNTAAFPSSRLPWRIGLCKLPGFGPALVRGLNAFAWPATWMAMHRRSLGADEQRGLLLPYDSWANRVGVAAFVRDIPMSPAHPTWTTLQVVADGLGQFRDRPALIVWGGRDFCFNDHFFGEWRARLPQAETLYLADAGHYVLTDANTVVVPRLAAFLTR